MRVMMGVVLSVAVLQALFLQSASAANAWDTLFPEDQTDMSVAKNYPSKFPFDKETVKPPALLKGSPNFKLDGTDTGGYVQLLEECNPYVYSPTNVGRCPGYHFMWNKKFGLPKFNGNNCTKKGINLDITAITGKLGTMKVCEAGACCKAWNGQPLNTDSTKDKTFQWETIVNANSCPQMPEHVYCGLLYAGAAITLCDENYDQKVATKRLAIMPCYDTLHKFSMSCPGLKIAGFKDVMVKSFGDSDPYLSKLSTEQSVASYMIVQDADMVCAPESYFAPAGGDDPTPSSHVALSALAPIVGMMVAMLF